MNSIRRRTLGLTLLLFLLSIMVISVISYRYTTHEIQRLHDESLARHAHLLGELLQAPIPPAYQQALLRSVENTLQTELRTPDALVFQLWQGDKLLLRSADAPLASLVTSTQAPAAGYARQQHASQTWQTYTLPLAQGERRVIVAERDDVRLQLIKRVALRTLLPEFIGLIILASLLWWSIGWGLAPLSRMAEQIRSRDPHNLQPLELSPLPYELATISGALNRLLMRIQRLRGREKRFIADAAHELRTPLAVLDLHAQNALAASTAQDREESLVYLRQGVTRATHLVSQLLTLARLDPDEASPPRRAVDALFEVRDALAKLLPLAQQQQQNLQLEAEESGPWALNEVPGALGTLIQNLVGNAIQHSPPNGSVHVHLEAGVDHIVLTVDDQGPGIPPAARKAVTARFHRAGPGAGSGLGLSIVERVVTQQGGTLAFDDAPGGGLRVQITLERRLSPD
ncbi:sensor histidine kinase N-terminal domain-containing protein [Halomonas aquamarina]|uniref:Sensor histidine kinase N-terminal domain-containing protein n=1 Tax=Vreelandella aquamarina TaxID=77097 RepID=A0ACC5VT90_9GAMM|nr:ATP-binding protein [Halomonas aquamarina]MBZ5487460.1 sensor histidine kinase N-terminal domain-containing protein [Halomonas aquamarina]